MQPRRETSHDLGSSAWMKLWDCGPATILVAVATCMLLAAFPSWKAWAPAAGTRQGSACPAWGADVVEARISSQLTALAAICPNLTFASCKGADRRLWSSASASRVGGSPCLAPAGHWSFLTLEAFTASGRRARAGGDSWVVQLRHEASGSLLRSRVFDEGDGRYLVAFLPWLPGTYTAEAWLLYSRCLGYQDMPGGPTADYARDGASLEDWCYIGDRLALPPVTIPASAPGAQGQGATKQQQQQQQPRPGLDVGLAAVPSSRLAPVYRAQEHVFRNGSGFVFDPDLAPGAAASLWQNASRPQQQHKQQQQQPPLPSRLVLCGDSTLLRSFMLLALAASGPCTLMAAPRKFWHRDKRAELARGLQGRCGDGSLPPQEGYAPYTLRPPLAACLRPASPSGLERVRTTTDNPGARFARFRPTAAAGQRPGTLRVHYSSGQHCLAPQQLWERTLQHIRPGDTLLLNLGLHCVMTATFAIWRQRMDELADMLSRLPAGASAIWRTSPAVAEHEVWRGSGWVGSNFEGDSSGSGLNYVQRYHFLTEPRRQLFDAYAEAAMRRAGVRVLDVSGLPVDYSDHVHWDMVGFDVHNQVLEQALC